MTTLPYFPPANTNALYAQIRRSTRRALEVSALVDCKFCGPHAPGADGCSGFPNFRPANEREVHHGPQVVVRYPHPTYTRPTAVIEALPLHVQARLACIEAIGSFSGSMVSAAHAIRDPGA